MNILETISLRPSLGIHRLAGRDGDEFVLVSASGRWRPGVFASELAARAAAHLSDDILTVLQAIANRRIRPKAINVGDIAEALNS